MKKKMGRGSVRFVLGWTLFLLCGVALVRYWPLIFPRAIVQSQPVQPADVGAQFEVLSTLFTALAFIAVLWTLQLQREQIEEQRLENRSREQEAARERMLYIKQQVKADFFQLLNAWQEIIHNTSYYETEGREAFVSLSAKCKEVRSRRPENGQQRQGAINKISIKDFYDSFYSGQASAALGNYFRLLYHILKYLKYSQLNSREKAGLASILRAHISEPEHYLLFWNGASEHGEKMHALIERYSLLHNFDWKRNGISAVEYETFYPRNYKRAQAEEAKRLNRLSGLAALP